MASGEPLTTFRWQEPFLSDLLIDSCCNNWYFLSQIPHPYDIKLTLSKVKNPQKGIHQETSYIIILLPCNCCKTLKGGHHMDSILWQAIESLQNIEYIRMCIPPFFAFFTTFPYYPLFILKQLVYISYMTQSGTLYKKLN
jgi:hypothetical protein